MKSAAKGVYYGGVRGLARVVPMNVLYFLLYPYSALRGVRRAVQMKHLPVRHVPPRPTDRAPDFARRWHYQASINHRWRPMFWADLDSQEGWADRVSVEGDTDLVALSSERPIVVVTLHTGAMIALGGWLMSQGLGVGNVIIDRERWLRPESIKMRSDPRWQKYAAQSGAFLAGETRQMIRFLEPNKVLMLPADHHLGRTADGEWANGRLTLAVGGLRIARIAGAAVIPIIATDDGHWRFRVHVGKPLSEATLASGDDSAAVTEIARQVMPIVELRPFEALPTLIRAVSTKTPTAQEPADPTPN